MHRNSGYTPMMSIPSSCNAVKVYKRVRQLSNRLLSIAYPIMIVLPEHYNRILTHSADTFERLPDHFPIFQSDAIGYEAFKLPYQQSLCILLICPQFRFVSKFGDKESNGSIVQSLKTVQMVYKSFTMTKLLIGSCLQNVSIRNFLTQRQPKSQQSFNQKILLNKRLVQAASISTPVCELGKKNITQTHFS